MGMSVAEAERVAGKIAFAISSRYDPAYTGPVIGSHTGAGVIGLFSWVINDKRIEDQIRDVISSFRGAGCREDDRVFCL